MCRVALDHRVEFVARAQPIALRMNERASEKSRPPQTSTFTSFSVLRIAAALHIKSAHQVASFCAALSKKSSLRV